MPTNVQAALAGLNAIRPTLTELYKDLHQHPELSFAEHRTAEVVAQRLSEIGLEVTTGVGHTGVVGVLRNGVGPTVLLRADFDALPVAEQTGLAYASTATGTDPDGTTVPVMHACGHDMHVSCLEGALRLLRNAAHLWSGTVLAVFQPAEEIGTGARAMIEDGLFERFGTPSVCLGQHVMPVPAGTVAAHPGPCFSASDSFRVTLHGTGGHGSRPEAAVDPVVMAAATVMRLQTVVSREIAGDDMAVVTVGSLHAGSKENIIPDSAELKLNIRSYDEEVRQTVLAAVRRIIHAESVAAGAPREPRIEPLGEFPVLVNTPEATEHTMDAFRDHFGDSRVFDSGRITGSEDVGLFAEAAGAPNCYWLFGGADPDTYARAAEAGRVAQDIPANHSPFFAPVIEPTLGTGVSAMVTAALAWLGPPQV
ncbi:amidohydrolase [Lipingzhangella sp. LS1_29]|uniref:Amidohydrolase n=1 Tax=Lipingzhangella rawalii TaxID=2055835 RepID=A0ABU2H371_9ACTN|nr:amidohydrolase [Lipingzhangella rawalii]MDS1269255.1 amidohydrolase [Lipingzhangella rawalii]